MINNILLICIALQFFPDKIFYARLFFKCLLKKFCVFLNQNFLFFIQAYYSKFLYHQFFIKHPLEAIPQRLKCV